MKWADFAVIFYVGISTRSHEKLCYLSKAVFGSPMKQSFLIFVLDI